VALSAYQHAGGAVGDETASHHFGRQFGLAYTGRANNEERWQRGPKSGQSILLGLVQILEGFVLPIGVAQALPARSANPPRISQHLREINTGVQCLDVAKSATDNLLSASVALGSEKVRAAVGQCLIDLELIGTTTLVINNIDETGHDVAHPGGAETRRLADAPFCLGVSVFLLK